MNNRIQQLEVQKLMHEYGFLLLDEQYKNEIIAEHKDEFLRIVHEIGNIASQQTDTSDTKIPKQSIDPTTIPDSLKTKIKKLYREIAKLTHPDRTTNTTYLELYMQATDAVDEFDLVALYDICAKLGIHHAVDAEDVDLLKQRIAMKRRQLTEIESSFIWLYAHSPSEEARQDLVTRFINAHGKKL